MHSLKTKLVLAISVMIVILFSLTTFIFINEKSKELAKNIYDHSRSFAELTAGGIASNYKLYLAQNSFVYFNREINAIFEKMGDLEEIQLIKYGGEILYDSKTEREQQYEGAARMLTEKELLTQVQSRNPSLLTLDTKRVVYLKRDETGQTLYLDSNEQPVKSYSPDEKMVYLVQPASDESAVVFYISYQSLYDSVNQTIIREVMLAFFGIGIGILMAFLYAGSITKPLKKLTEGAGVIAKGDFKYRVEVKTKDEIAVLAHAFNKMAQDLEVSTKALVYKERVAKELELAAKIQKEILPKEIPKMPGLDLAAGLIPAEEIGGDSYDFIKIDNNDLLMYLGDVTGHGVPSGIVVSVANALIYNYSKASTIKEMLIGVNRILKEKSSANMFMTLVMLKWEGLAKKLRYVSAGHEQMIHFHANEKKVTLTPAGGVALGMLSDISRTLNEQEVDFQVGDVLVVYSDGIPECWKNEKEMYGMGNLKRAVSEYSDLPTAFAIRNALIADVKEYEGKYKQMDDITLIVMKRTS